MGQTLDSMAFISAIAFDDATLMLAQDAEQAEVHTPPSDLPEPRFGSAEVAPPQPAPSPAPTLAVPVEGTGVTLFALEFDHATLSESMATYGDAADPLLPVSEIARLLDLDIEVLPRQHTINGRIGESRRALTVDLDRSVARIGPVEVPLGSGSAGVSLTEIYLKASLLEQLLPLKLQVDPDDYRVTIVATEKLPVQNRAERRQRIYNLGDAPVQGADAVMTVDTPYRWLGHPAFDVSADIGTDRKSVV